MKLRRRAKAKREREPKRLYLLAPSNVKRKRSPVDWERQGWA